MRKAKVEKKVKVGKKESVEKLKFCSMPKNHNWLVFFSLIFGVAIFVLIRIFMSSSIANIFLIFFLSVLIIWHLAKFFCHKTKNVRVAEKIQVWATF